MRRAGQVGSADDCGYSLTSCVVLTVSAGTQYYAQVDGYSSRNTGLVEFTVSATPANDNVEAYVGLVVAAYACVFVCVWAVATSDGQRRSLMYRVAVWHRVCCCSAIALTTGVPVTGTNMGATYQSGEQAAVANSGGSSTIWYTWTPASSASFTVTTANSAFDTTLAVYRVTASGNLYRVSGAADYTIPLVEECATHTTQARSLSRMGVC